MGRSKKKILVDGKRVKGGVAQEGRSVNQRMLCKEVLKYWYQ